MSSSKHFEHATITGSDNCLPRKVQAANLCSLFHRFNVEIIRSKRCELTASRQWNMRLDRLNVLTTSEDRLPINTAIGRVCDQSLAGLSS